MKIDDKVFLYSFVVEDEQIIFMAHKERQAVFN